MLANEQLPNSKNSLKKLHLLAEKLNLFCGASYPFTDISLLHYAYLQALESANYLRKSRSSNALCHFSEIFITSFFENQTHRKSFYVHPAILRIYEYDKEKHTDLMHTFYVYLANHHTLDSCAEKLFIHKNTLKQRLKKLQEIVGEDFYKERDIHFKSLISIILLECAY